MSRFEKFYQQVKLNPKDWDIQGILWCENFNKDPKESAILEVVFGTVSAPFLAQPALKQCAQDETPPESILRKTVKRNFNMDDLMFSYDNENELLPIALSLRSPL
jgi:hypothetical protein